MGEPQGSLPGRCASCQHWKPFELFQHTSDGVIVKNKLGLCERIVSKERYWHCEYDIDKDDWASETSAALEDLSDHCAFRCAADFGCVLYEVRP